MSRCRRKLRTTHKSEITFAGGIYHITQRAPGKELLFIDEDDYLRMVALLKETSESYGLDIFAFCCMPNHIHLLLRTNKDNLIISMKHAFQQYARYFNRKYRRKGHVFCGTFAAALCQYDDYFLTISLYIHLNPCAAGICHDPSHYQWCSVRVYAEAIPETFINRKYLFELLDKNTNTARKIYREMLNATRDIKIKKFIFSNKDSASFKHKIVESLKRDEFFQSFLDRLFARVVCKDEIKIVTAAKGRRIRSHETLQRRRYIIEQLKAEGYSITDIGEKLKLSRRMIHRIISSH
jgi:putative transposase